MVTFQLFFQSGRAKDLTSTPVLVSCRSYCTIHFELLQLLRHLGTLCTCVQDGEETEIEVEGESHTTIDSMVLEPLEATNPDVAVDDVEALIDANYTGKLKPVVEAAIKAKWGKIMGPDVEIVVKCKLFLCASQLTFRHRASCIWDRHFATLQRMLFICLINKYISLFDICLTVHH